MLLTGDSPLNDQSNALDSVHNFYERQVFEELRRQLPEAYGNNNYIADIACVALNHLPPRYIRHDVDMMFYLSPSERHEIQNKVSAAVIKAIAIVDTNNKK